MLSMRNTHWLQQNLVTRRLSMHENWLHVGWACAKVGYLRADHTQKSFWHTTCIFGVFPQFPCLPSYVPSHVFVSCLPSSVLCLTSLFLVSRPLYPVSRDLSAVSFPLFSVPQPLSNVPVSPFLWLYSTVHILCYSVSRPLFLGLLSFVPLALARMFWVLLSKIHANTYSRRFRWLAAS